MENVPALKDEPFVANLGNYRARIQFEIKDYKKAYYSRYGSTIVKADLYETWTDYW